MGVWRTSNSSRSAESVDREWEEVGVVWARVRRGPKANVNSHRVLQMLNSLYEGYRYNQLEMGWRTQYTLVPQSAKGGHLQDVL